MEIFKMKKTISVSIVALLISLILPGCALTAQAGGQTPTDNLNAYKNNTVFMHAGSPLILNGDEISFLDPDDFDVAVKVHKQRTLVPLRAVAEYLGGEVSYDSAKHEAVVSHKGVQYIFPIGKQDIVVKKNGSSSKITMDTEALLLKNRTMVPVRIIAEELFGKTVDYKDGVILISDKALNLAKESGLVAAVKSKIGTATKARSESQLAGIFKRNNEYRGPVRAGDDMAVSESSMNIGGGAMEQDSQKDSSAPSVDFGSNESTSSDYSSTNVQVHGIDEADIVKTDGKYLYYAGSNAVRIIKADGSKLSEVATIRLPDEQYVHEIYLDNDRLILLGNRSENDGEYHIMSAMDDVSNRILTPEVNDLPVDKMIYPGYYKSFAFADIYDVSKPENPVYLKGHEMEGNYLSSRKSGEHVYLITNSGWHGGGVRPLAKDTVRGGKVTTPVEIADIMVMPEPPQPGFIIISAMDITDNSKTEVEAITAFGATVYMNESAMYLASDNFNGDTNITKFRIDGMNIGYAGAGTVKGYLLNQFSMDEFQGNLRVATTLWDKGNNLYVLNDSLNVVGSVTGLAKGETIYSVRFMGDKGYIVTFRTMDPLFVFDLSDPTSPKVTGELKIPGFSNYLHPVGDDLILGIGMETRELYEKDSSGKEIPVGFRQGGLKVSLFDVSDMGKPEEIANYIVGENGSYSEALYNHKAVMIDAAKQQIAFDTFIVKDKDWKNSNQGALVVSYKDKKIKEKGFLKSEPQEVYGKYIPYGRRVAYIGNILYYIQDGIINAYDYSSLEKTGTLVLK